MSEAFYTQEQMIRTRNENYNAGVETERERIIKLLEVWWETDQELEELIALIKGEHKHDIDVFGAPCACGTHHEYCNNCDWVEPCEPDFIKGESN